jgi:hypothetical protein
MKSATSGDKSSGIGGFVLSIRLQKINLLLYLPLKTYKLKYTFVNIAYKGIQIPYRSINS